MRFALYYTPQPPGLLWKLGSRWLGWDVLAQEEIRQTHYHGIAPDRIAELTRIPKHYGLHATLKAPFRLTGDRTENELRSAINEFAAGWQAFSTAPLVLRQIDDFFCLCTERAPQLDALAAACVQKFDVFRAPLTRLEYAHRRAETHTIFQKQNLKNWGYPYVLSEYHFHITLTARIKDASEKSIIYSLLSDVLAPVLGKPLEVEAVCLFIEPFSGLPFFCAEYFPFNGIKTNTSS